MLQRGAMVRRVQLGQHLGGIEPSRFGECARHNLERVRVGADGVLRQAGRSVGKRGQALGELQLGGAGTWHKRAVLGNGFDCVDAVVDGALDVVELIWVAPRSTRVAVRVTLSG